MKPRTDVEPIQYPTSLCVSERRHCRNLIVEAAKYMLMFDEIVIGCSAGIDSSVLVHACGQALRIIGKDKRRVSAVYLNHHLRPDAVAAEALHVQTLAREHLSYVTPSIDLDVKKGHSLQERARRARYEAFANIANSIQANSPLAKIAIFTAHNKCDDAETKLFQFMRGMKQQPGIPRTRKLDGCNAIICRPFLNFSRQDIERYTRCFGLHWCEDSSNAHDDYTRNRIRHDLIPWIQGNVNPGFINMLSRMRDD